MVYFQPKYDLSTEKIIGAEALVRWIHPEMGFMSPGDFIPLFEKNGFVTDLDIYMWDHVCGYLEQWKKQGINTVPVSANLSRVDIYHPGIADIIKNIVKKHGLSPEDLHIEITESAYTESANKVIQTLSDLKNMGFEIEMDDFGTGYSSLNMLSELPIDILKLDIKFVQEHKTRKGRSMIGYIISLAKWMGLSVVAEGVEEEAQVILLRSLDCNYVQGYYYAKPMPAEDFEKELLLDHERTMHEKLRPTQYELPEIKIKGHRAGMTLLIVDDIPMNRAALRATFEDLFPNIEECENGREAIEYVEGHASEIAVVLLDLLMPEVDGFKVIERLRENERTKDVPIIVTSIADEDCEEQVLALGADEFINKPYRPFLVRHRVAQQVYYAELKAERKEEENR